jgi:hypothetical protein
MRRLVILALALGVVTVFACNPAIDLPVSDPDAEVPIPDSGTEPDAAKPRPGPGLCKSPSMALPLSPTYNLIDSEPIPAAAIMDLADQVIGGNYGDQSTYFSLATARLLSAGFQPEFGHVRATGEGAALVDFGFRKGDVIRSFTVDVCMDPLVMDPPPFLSLKIKERAYGDITPTVRVSVAFAITSDEWSQVTLDLENLSGVIEGDLAGPLIVGDNAAYWLEIGFDQADIRIGTLRQIHYHAL